MKVHSEKSFEMKSEENDSDAPIISSGQKQNVSKNQKLAWQNLFCVLILTIPNVLKGVFFVSHILHCNHCHWWNICGWLEYRRVQYAFSSKLNES